MRAEAAGKAIRGPFYWLLITASRKNLKIFTWPNYRFTIRCWTILLIVQPFATAGRFA